MVYFLIYLSHAALLLLTMETSTLTGTLSKQCVSKTVHGIWKLNTRARLHE